MKTAFLALVLFAVVGCRPSSPLVDKWVSGPTTYEFRGDGKFLRDIVISNYKIETGGSYVLAGDQLSLSDMHTFTYDNKSQALIMHEPSPDEKLTLRWVGKDEIVLTDKKGSTTYKRAQ